MSNDRYARLSEDILRDFILSGSVKPGQRLPSVRMLETQYGMGRSTVWHALGLLESKGYLEKRRGSGCYVVDRNDGASVTLNKMIGFAAPCTGQPQEYRYYQLQKGVEETCEQYGYCMLVVSTSRSDYDLEYRKVRQLVERGCPGVVLLPAPRSKARIEHDYLIGEFQDTPIVLLDVACREQNRPRVIFDNRQAGFDMMDMLVKRGHSRIAIFTAPEDLIHPPIHEKYDGYLDALKYHGLAVRPDHVFSMTSYIPLKERDLYYSRIITYWKNSPDPFTAIVAFSDYSAEGLIQCARDAGVRVPEELTVAGFDGIEIRAGKQATFPTTLPDFKQAGRIAARMLIEFLEKGKVTNDTYILPVPVIDDEISR